MAQFIDKIIDQKITAHQTAIDLLQAIQTINDQMEKVDPNMDPESRKKELARYNRQRQILVSQYNEIVKPVWPLSIDHVEPIELNDELFSEKIRKHITPRLFNCLKRYFKHYHMPFVETPTIRDLFNVDRPQFITLRNVGVGTANELERFVAKLRHEAAAA